MASLTQKMSFEYTAGDSEGQGSLVGRIPWGHKKSDVIDRLKNTTTSSHITLTLLSTFQENDPC